MADEGATVVSRATSFGFMRELGLASGDWAEHMVFREPGTGHSHDRYELAVCVSGRGEVEVGGEVGPARAPDVHEIPPGVEHRMVPDPGSDEPFEWLLAYSDDPFDLCRWTRDGA